jgi:hypothetical protein
MPLPGETPCLAPSLHSQKSGTQKEAAVPGEQCRFPNPTVIPRKLLSQFHFTFLIRNPRKAIPSLYECSIPPKCFMTGWHGFKPSDAGYKELRRIFDYLIGIGQIGPSSGNEICLVDAEDLLAYPEEIVKSFCLSVGITFDSRSLYWGAEKDQQRAQHIFKNWAPFHEAALQSISLKGPPSVSH